MIFLDSNIPMYLVGAEHANKARTEKTLRRLVAARERLVTDVEVFQEILHRYAAIRRRDAIEPAWQALAGIVDETFPIDLESVELAKRLTLEEPRISARDAVHTAVMRLRGVQRILSFDRGFDEVAGIVRIT